MAGTSRDCVSARRSVYPNMPEWTPSGHYIYLFGLSFWLDHRDSVGLF
jgi:hypothetical protein